MPKYKVFTATELIKLLQFYGFEIVRTKGSHTILQKYDNNSTITLPIPLHKEIKIGTLTSIVRQSKLPKEIFEVSN